MSKVWNVWINFFRYWLLLSESYFRVLLNVFKILRICNFYHRCLMLLFTWSYPLKLVHVTKGTSTFCKRVQQNWPKSRFFKFYDFWMKLQQNAVLNLTSKSCFELFGPKRAKVRPKWAFLNYMKIGSQNVFVFCIKLCWHIILKLA